MICAFLTITLLFCDKRSIRIRNSTNTTTVFKCPAEFLYSLFYAYQNLTAQDCTWAVYFVIVSTKKTHLYLLKAQCSSTYYNRVNGIPTSSDICVIKDFIVFATSPPNSIFKRSEILSFVTGMRSELLLIILSLGFILN